MRYINLRFTYFTYLLTYLQLSGFYLGQPGWPVLHETFTHLHLSWSL